MPGNKAIKRKNEELSEAGKTPDWPPTQKII